MLTIFNKLNLFNAELDATWKRNEVIGCNIANSDVPNFKARRLEFKSVLEKELGGEKNHQMRATREKHLGKADEFVAPRITVDYGTSMRLDGNNVDMENEMVRLTANNLKYGFLVQKLSKEISKLRYAINEGKR